MLDQIDQRLESWVQSVVGDTAVTFLPPTEDNERPSVNLYLFELVETPPASGSRTSPLQFSVRYLLTSYGSDSAETHSLLSKLAFAALADGEMDVAMGGISAETWLALNTIPQPAIVITEVVRKARPEPKISFVTQPMVVKTLPTAALVGRVLGPRAMPITGARIDCPSLSRSTYSDTKGRFTLPNLPTGTPIRLNITAKGRKLTVDVNKPSSDADPLLIEFAFDD